MSKISVRLIIVIVLVLGACTKPTPVPPTPIPTLDQQATESALAVANELATQNAEKTAQSIQTADAQKTLDAKATKAAQGTENAAATSTHRVLNAQATTTQAFSRKQTSTAEAISRATKQAEPLFEWVQKLFNDGFASTIEGEYYRLLDFDQNLAEIGHGRYWPSGYVANNFVLSAHISLSSGSDKANWQDSSCGFIFGEESERSYDLADVAMDGNIYMWNCRGGKCIPMAVMRYGPQMVPKGQADIVLTVFEKHILFYVDGNKIVSAGDTRYVPGNIAYLMRSGTNKDFGTRCQMTNIGLWIYP